MKKTQSPDIKLPKVTVLPSGAAHTRVMIEGERYSITADTEAQCIAKYLALKHRIEEAKKQQKVKKKTLAAAIDDYIDLRDGLISPATIRAYKSYRKNRFQSMMPTDIYKVTDTQWQTAIKREMKGLSPKYVSNVWGLVSAAILENTGRKPQVTLPGEEKNEHPYLEPEQILTFVDAMKGRTAEIPALLELSSLRCSEMLALKWTDVDLERNIIHVRGARVRDKDGQLVHKKRNKNDTSRRTIPIIPPLRDALETASRHGEYVVTMKGDGVYKQVNRVCASLGFPKIGNHGLRHSFASLAYHLQIPEKIAMEIGGWANDQTMRKIYTHLAKQDISRRSADFSNFFLPSSEVAEI